jgi:hypothetical protein
MGQVAGQSMSDSIVAFFDGTGGTGSLWDQFKEGTQASRGASIAGGAYGVYSAYQSGDPLSGAISGAIAGTAIGSGYRYRDRRDRRRARGPVRWR